LTHDVAYQSVLSERRKFLHERTGQAIERLCMDRLDECVDELAHHFTRSGNAVKAVEYLHRAGVQAATRSSHQDACRQLRQALSMLATLPESRERHAREIKLQFALGESLLMGRGITHPEIEPVSERLRVLCEAVGDHVQLGVALIMLATYYRNLGQLARAA